MQPACIKAGVARKSRGQKWPYGFDSRPRHIIERPPSVRSLFYTETVLSYGIEKNGYRGTLTDNHPIWQVAKNSLDILGDMKNVRTFASGHH